MDQQHSLADVGNHINSFYQKKPSTSIFVGPTQFGNYNQDILPKSSKVSACRFVK